MAIVAKMNVVKVTQHGGGKYVPCEEFDEGATPIADVAQAHSYYGVVAWLDGHEFLRFDPKVTSSEFWELQPVSRKDDADDDNREFSEATPSGKLELSVQNPACFGYVTPGYDYRITIERIRGPRHED